MNNEWSKFDFQAITTNRSAYQIEKIAHIVHAKDAIDLVRSDRVKGEIVYDESRFTALRDKIVWLSPFDWIESIYGSVCFYFDWRKIVSGKSLYWIEAKDYKRPTVRFFADGWGA